MGSVRPIYIRLLLVVLAATVLVLAFFARARFNDLEQEKIADAVGSNIASLHKAVRDELDAQNALLDRFAQRLAAAPNPQDPYWTKEAAPLLEAPNGILAVGYVNKALDISWSVPPKFEDSVAKAHAVIRDNRPFLLTEALEQGKVRISEPVQVAQRGKVFIAYYPLKRDNKASELLVAVLHLQILVDKIFSKAIPKDVPVTLMDGYTEVYSRGSQKARVSVPEFTDNVTVLTAKWKVRLWPSQAMMNAYKSDWPQWAVWGGGLTSLLILVMAFLPMPSDSRDDVPAPAATPAEWARRWDAALRSSDIELAPSGAAGTRSSGDRPPAEMRKALDESLPWVAAIANVADPVFITELETVPGAGMPIVYINGAFSRWTGFQWDSIIGKTQRTLVGPETDGKTLEAIRTAQTRRLPMRADITLYRKDGTPLPGTLSMRPVTDNFGRPTHWIFIHHPAADMAPLAVPSPAATEPEVASPLPETATVALPTPAAASPEAPASVVVPQPEPVIVPTPVAEDEVAAEPAKPAPFTDLIRPPKRRPAPADLLAEAATPEPEPAVVSSSQPVTVPELTPEPVVAEPVLATRNVAEEPLPATASADALEMLIEEAPLAVIGCDLAGQVTLWSKAAERILGWPEGERLGLPAGVRDFPPRHAHGEEFETELAHRDGRTLPLSAWSVPLKNAQGDVGSWLLFLSDISARKAAEQDIKQREGWLRSLVDSTGDLLIVLDPDSTIRFANPAAERLLGIARESLLGRRALDLIQPDDQGTAVQSWLAALRDEPGAHYATLAFEAADSSIVTLETQASRFIGADALLVAGRDVTGRQPVIVAAPEPAVALVPVPAPEPVAAPALRTEQAPAVDDILEQVGEAILSLDPNFRVLAANAAARRLFDWQERPLNGRPLDQLLGGWEQDPAPATIASDLNRRGAWRGELKLRRPNGESVTLESSFSSTYDAHHERTGYLAIHRDVTERRRAEEALRASEERYALAASSANDGLWDWNLIDDEIYYAPRWKAMLGYDPSRIANLPDEWFMLVHPSDVQNLKALIAKHLKGQTPVLEAEYRIRRQDGQYVWVATRAKAVRDDKGRAVRMVGSQSDISEQKAVEDQLLHEAFHDALTGLPNRVLFNDRLGVLLDRARHGKNPKPFAVLFLDIDRFKYINDSLGHLAGDEFLMEVGRRLHGCVSESDTIARQGGDEFTVLLDNVPGAWAVQAACDKIQKAIAVPMLWQGQEIYSSVSIGSTISTLGYERPDEMVRDADTALYQAKGRGRGRHVAFDKTMHAEARARLQIEADLRRALERNEFRIVFQPLVALGMGPNQGRLAGFEALLRWHHPSRGVLTPATFMTAAEETGLILDIDRWVLRESCAQMRRWLDQHPESGPLHVSVNLSGQHFQQLDLAEQIRNVLRATNLNPEFLRIELTESILVKSQRAAEVFRELKEIKVQLNLDDFGTGYSSLSYLSKYPIDRLKIDRSFIRNMEGSAQSGEIIRGILLIARNLRINVVAEGVETAEQLDKLRAFGCEYAQGYFISQPLDPETATRLIASNPRW